jgi:hypothetical protein
VITPKVEATETLVLTYQNTRRHTSEEGKFCFCLEDTAESKPTPSESHKPSWQHGVHVYPKSSIHLADILTLEALRILCFLFFKDLAPHIITLDKITEQNAGQNHNIKKENKSCKIVENLKYFGTNLTNRNFIHREIKSRLISWNACYHSVKNILSSSVPSKSITIKILRNVMLPVVYGCET